MHISTEFFKCLSGEKEAKEFEDHEQKGLPVANTISQVPVRHPRPQVVQTLQSLFPETLRDLTTKNTNRRICAGVFAVSVFISWWQNRNDF